MTKTTAIERTDKLGFEIKTCPRCGGSGKFSYCQMYGDRCFGCGGSGVVYTKRGHAARAKLSELRSKPASEVRVGDVILAEGFACGSVSVKSAWHTVETIEPDALNPGLISLKCKNYGLGAYPTSMIRIRQTAEQAAATLAAALVFQATLTKLGKPSARGSK